MTLSDDTLARLPGLLSEATPGPWEWGGYPSDLRLQTSYGGKRFVMTFARKGMNGAQPRFQIKGRGMVGASDLLQFQVGDPSVVGEKAAEADPTVYRRDVRGVAHADARLIALAPDLARDLLAARAEVERLRGQLADALEAERLEAGEREARGAVIERLKGIVAAARTFIETEMTAGKARCRGPRPMQEVLDRLDGEAQVAFEDLRAALADAPAGREGASHG